PRRPGHRRAAAQSLASLALARLALIRPTRARPARARQSGYSAVSSSISVTRAAIGDRSDLVRVTCANSGWPFSFSITATTPSWRPTRRLSRCATSWVSTTRDPATIRDSTVSSTPRSRDWASSTITNESCSDRPDVGQRQDLQHVAHQDVLDDL